MEGVLFISLGRLRGLLYSVIRLKFNNDLVITDRHLQLCFFPSTLDELKHFFTLLSLCQLAVLCLSLQEGTGAPLSPVH